MSIDPEEQGTVDIVLFAVLADRLRNGENVPFIETAIQCGAAMSGSSEHNPLRGPVRVGDTSVVGSDKPWHIHQHLGLRRFSGVRIYFHVVFIAADFSRSPVN
jgi:hypothetical protein